MNRRSFLRTSALALFGFTILPGAGRIWNAAPTIISPTIQLITPFRYLEQRATICTDQSYEAFREAQLNRFNIQSGADPDLNIADRQAATEHLLKTLFPLRYG